MEYISKSGKQLSNLESNIFTGNKKQFLTFQSNLQHTSNYQKTFLHNKPL